MAKRLTIFVMAIKPTFWLKDVLGSTPKNAAIEEPRPSQITEPDSSLSVASLARPPSVIAEVSPTVSTAVTINIITIGMIARRSIISLLNPKGINAGTANQLASLTFEKSRTQEQVFVTVSCVFGSIY